MKSSPYNLPVCDIRSVSFIDSLRFYKPLLGREDEVSTGILT